MRLPWRLLAALLLLAGASAAFGQACTYEAEPNDAPHQALRLRREGAVSAHAYCLTGELSSGSDQDFFLWEVGEEEAGRWWTLEAEGVPGQLTTLQLFRLRFADDGVGVLAADPLLEVRAQNGAPGSAGPFLVAPGRYHVGLKASGGSGGYVALLREGDPISRRSTAASSDRGVRGAFSVFGPAEGGLTQPFDIDADGAGQVWEASLQASIGDRPALRLVGAGGTVAEATVGADGLARLRSLGLEQGSYQLQAVGAAGLVQMQLQSTGRRGEGQEIEPNDDWANANVLPIGSSMRGSLDGDRDVFRIEVDEAASAGAWDLLLQADGEVTLELFDAEQRLLQSRRGRGAEVLGLHLAEGSYQLRLQGDRGSSYQLDWRPVAQAAAGHEREPNDTVGAAHAVGEDGQLRAELQGAADVDVLRHTVEGGAQLYRLQAVGEGVEDLALIDRGGRVLAEARGSGRLRIDDLLLLPGEHFFRIRGSGGAYAFRAIALGPAPDGSEAMGAPGAEEAIRPAAAAASEPEGSDPDGGDPASIATPLGPPPPPGRLEREPNDDSSRAERLQAGELRVGRLYGPGDTDRYRFYLAEDQLVRLELVPPEGDVSLRLNLDGSWHERFPHEQGSPTVVERWLLAGDHEVFLSGGDGVPSGYYQLRLNLLGRLDLPPVVKPNDRPALAGLLPAELSWRSRVGGADGDEFFRLPGFGAETEMWLRIEAEAGGVEAAIVDGGATQALRAQDGLFRATLPAGGELLLRLRGRTAYTAEIGFGSDPDPAQLQAPRGEGLALAWGSGLANRDAGEDGVSDGGIADDLAVAAFWHEGQVLHTEVVVRNGSDRPQALRLEGAVNEPRASVELPAELQLAAGQSATVPLTLRLPPDLRDDLPLRLEVAATGDRDRAVTAVQLQPRCEAMPVGSAPHPVWSTVLRGRLDLLWEGFGARVADEATAAGRDRSLLDGRVTPSTGANLGADRMPTFRLAGEQPALLVGTILHPLADGSVSDQLKGFRIETSMDGLSFSAVFEGELKAARIEQAFVFDTPVLARYARLVMLSNQGSGGVTRLGEWKLLAEDPAAMGPFDLGDPALGGHLVWSNRLLDGQGGALLSHEADVRQLDMRDGGDLAFVVGFHHGRAARIERLVWHESQRATSDGLFARATVEASLTGPAGPWTPLADWTLVRGADGRATLELEEAPWVRYLRLTLPAVEGQRHHWPPDRLQVIEQPAGQAGQDGGEGYLSILGEWGLGAREAVYEATHPAPATASFQAMATHGTRASAAPLGSGEVAQGVVLVAEQEAWYRISLPAGQNQLELRFSGDPSIAYAYRLEDAAGDPVAFELSEEGEGQLLRLHAEPGDYVLHLWEPRRSVVFSWDTSGSVAPYIATTYNALASFALGLDGEKELAQLLAFDNPRPSWLLPFWSAQPERVQRAINDDPRQADSSDAEPALLAAAQALAQREGTRAILLITDAESGGYGLTPELWAAMEEVRPRVFTFEVSSGGGDRAQDLMQAWAAVNHGVYDLATGVGSFDAGFARAACLLRRPKVYRVEVQTAAVAPPGPGRIAVRRAEGTALGAVEVIFDASGSMGRALPSGEQRITAAKRVLEELVGGLLPEGAPFALRAFGHLTPNSCEQRLDLPLAPLDRARALAAVRAIEPKLLSQTPLADALAAVAGDLAASAGGRTVILITDGVESCGGDPAAAVAALRAQGPLDLAIVSLGLEAEDLAAFQALAEQVGASHVDVGSYEELQASVEAALNPGFEVIDAAGEVVARGRVDGEPVELPMGVYTVRVLGPMAQEFSQVRLPGDSLVELLADRR